MMELSMSFRTSGTNSRLYLVVSSQGVVIIMTRSQGEYPVTLVTVVTKNHLMLKYMALVLKVDVICASKLGMTVSGCIYVKAWDDSK